MSDMRGDTIDPWRDAVDPRRNTIDQRRDVPGQRQDKDYQELCTIKGSCQYTECPMRRRLNGLRPFTNRVFVCRFLFKLFEFFLVFAALILLTFHSSEIKETCDAGIGTFHAVLPFTSAAILAFTVITFLTVLGFCICSPITRSVDATLCLLGFFLLGVAGVTLFFPQMSQSLCMADYELCKATLRFKKLNDSENILTGSFSKIERSNVTNYDYQYDIDDYDNRKKRERATHTFNYLQSHAKKQGKLPTSNEMFPYSPTTIFSPSVEETLLGERSTLEGQQISTKLTRVKNNGEAVTMKKADLQFEQKMYEICEKKINQSDINFKMRQLPDHQHNIVCNHTKHFEDHHLPGKQRKKFKSNSQEKLKLERKQKLSPLRHVRKEVNKYGDRIGEESKLRVRKSNPEPRVRQGRGRRMSDGDSTLEFTLKITGVLCIAAAILMISDVIRMGFCDMYY